MENRPHLLLHNPHRKHFVYNGSIFFTGIFLQEKMQSVKQRDCEQQDTHLKLLSSQLNTKNLHGRQSRHLVPALAQEDRLSFDWTSYIHFFFFFIVCDLYIQILSCIFFPLNLAVRASLLQGQKQTK